MTVDPQLTAWLTPEEAARHVKFHKRLLYREVAAGRLRAARVGGRRQLRFQVCWLNTWLENTATPIEVE